MVFSLKKVLGKTNHKIENPFLFGFWFVIFLYGVFGMTQNVGAVKCDDFSALGYACTAKSDCNPDVAAQTQTLIENNKELTAQNKDKKAAFIVGICQTGQVCCVKKKDAGGAKGAGGSSSSTSECGAVCQYIKDNYENDPSLDNYQGPIPKCAFSGTCRDVNDLVQVFINQGKLIFGIIGMIALTAFVYGGFLMVFSFGSPDKVKQGRDVMVAAVVGIIIVFSAYLIVAFILNTLGVGDEFKAIK